MKRILIISLLITLCFNIFPKQKKKIMKNKPYTWEKLNNIDYTQYDRKNYHPIYIGNYQDYWIDWSPDSDKIIALWIDSNEMGIHILDLKTAVFKVNNQRILVPFKLISKKSTPIPWKAKIIDNPMTQGFPSWCRSKDIVAYGEFSSDYSTSKVIVINFENNNEYEISFDFMPKIEGIDFSWNSELMAIYGDKTLVIHNTIENTIVKKYEVNNKIEQVSWFPDDNDILIVYNGSAYKHSITDLDKKEIFLKSASWSKICFIPNTTEVVYGTGQGLVILNYETNEQKQITSGFDYQPQVSPNGKWIAYISESPFGGFIVPTSLKGDNL